jgi:hypothetical protein
MIDQMKTKKIVSILMALLIVTVGFNCSNEDEAITHSMSDVSSRISGFGSDITGAGASLSVNGSQMDKVLRVFIGDLVVPAKAFTNVSESGFTFSVPPTAGVGVAKVMLVWPGSERGFTSIEIVPLQVINTIHPLSGGQGEVVTVHGSNLGIVTGVRFGAVNGTITENTGTQLKFTVPAGITTGKVSLVSPAGVVNSTPDFIACSADPNNIDCKQALTLNSGFEAGAGDNFDNWAKYNGGNFITATTVSTEVFRGSRALKVVRDGSLAPDQWRIQFASDLVDTDIGSSYTVYAWVKASVAGGRFRFSTQPSALYGGDTDIPTTWTRISWTFTANAEDTRVILDLNGAPVTTFFIDDVKLLKN